jgi:hypothetical protein
MNMRRNHSIGVAMFCVIGMSGCLSIGGKTYTTQSNPETETRLSALEFRLGTLEEVVMGSSAPSSYSAAATNTSIQAP